MPRHIICANNVTAIRVYLRHAKSGAAQAKFRVGARNAKPKASIAMFKILEVQEFEVGVLFRHPGDNFMDGSWRLLGFLQYFRGCFTVFAYSSRSRSGPLGLQGRENDALHRIELIMKGKNNGSECHDNMKW